MIHSRLGTALIACGLVFVLAASIGAQQVVETRIVETKKPSAADAIIEAGTKDNQVQAHLDYLTNRIGPRLTGSEGLQAGCEWARDEFKKMGLKNCRLEKWGEFPVGFERGPSTGRMLEPKTMNLSFGTNAWTSGTKGRVVGFVVIAPETAEAAKEQKEKMKGAYVFLKRPSRRSREAFTKYRELKAALAEFEPAGFVSSTSDERILTGGNYRVDPKNLPTIPEINLLKKQFDEIIKLVADGEKVKLGFDIRNHFRKGPVPLYNVIAEIPGTEKPEECVIVGGHIDSWDGATGATDNAAGCATAMEAARILMAAGVKPKRTIRFMLWSGEEQGLLGSLAYVKQNPKEMKNISAVLVHDGGTNYCAGILTPKSMKEDFESVFGPAMKLNPEQMPFELTEVPTLRARGGSDHVSFIRAGVPGFFWRQKGRAVYRTTHHTQYDTYETIVPEYQKHSSIVIALGAFGIADLDHMLSREHVNK